MSTRTRLLFAFYFAALSVRGLGQPAQPTPPAPAPAAPPAAQEAAAVAPAKAPAHAVPEVTIKDTAPAHVAVATKGKDASGKDTLSVDFPDEDVRSILRNVADLFELNLVIPEALQGKASIKLRDVSWRQIFQVILDPIGYTYVEEGNIVKIVS